MSPRDTRCEKPLNQSTLSMDKEQLLRPHPLRVGADFTLVRQCYRRRLPTTMALGSDIEIPEETW